MELLSVLIGLLFYYILYRLVMRFFDFKIKGKEEINPSEIVKKIKFYNRCSEELKKWADLRDSHAITEDEYQEKKEKGQYVKNALSSISFVIELIGNNEVEPLRDVWDEEYEFDLEGYIKKERDPYVKKNLQFFRSPQQMLGRWFDLRNSNAITEEEYQKLKEEFLRVECVNKMRYIAEQIEGWSSLRDLNAITEEEFQKFKVYLLDSDLKPDKR